MKYNIEQMCRDERYYKSVLYMIQALPDINIQYNLIERILHINLYFSVRIAHQMNMTEHFRSIFFEHLQKRLEQLQRDNVEIDEIITPLYIAIILQAEESFVQLTNIYLIPLLLQSENQPFNEAVSIMYESLKKEHLIRFFSILAENKLFAYIDPDRIYGRCSEAENEILRSMLLSMSQENDAAVMQKMVWIGFKCQIDGLFPTAFNKNFFNKKKYTGTWSVAMQLYIFYGILNGEQIPDEIFPQIMRNTYIITKAEFYDFLTEYALHYSIPDEAVYALIVSSRVNKAPMIQECVKKIAEGSTQLKLTLQMQQNLKIADFYIMCRNAHYINVVKFMIQNNPDEELRRRYFSTLARSNIYLAATVINSTYYNSEELEKLFNSILYQKLDSFSNDSQKNNCHPQELNHIVAALLIIGRYEEYELFMKEVFCPFLLNNKMNLGWFSNNLSADMMFKLICSMAKNGAVSKIIPYLILEYKVNDQHTLRELLKTVYYDNNTRDSSRPLRLTILMAEKYGVENLVELLETTDEAIDDRIRQFLKNKHPSKINKTQMPYLCFLEFRKPFEQLNEQELELLDQYKRVYFYPERILNLERKIRQSILAGNFFQSTLDSNHDNQDELLLHQSLSKLELNLDSEYMSLLQDEKRITALLKQYRAEYNASCDFGKKMKIKSNPDAYFQALKIIFESYQNVYNIIQVFFSLLYLFPLEAGIRYLYEMRGRDNDYLRFLLNDIVFSGLVKKSNQRSIYIFPASFLSANDSLQVTWCNGKVRSGSEDVVPKRKERIYCKFHSYDPIKNTVLLRCPAYTVEECKHYNARRKMKENQ